MKVVIKRVDNLLPLPKYESKLAAAFDLYSRETVTIAPQTIALLPSNLIIKVPEGYMLTVLSRSSTPLKKGLLIPHGLGLIDPDYCGPEDEIKMQVYNFTAQPVTVARGERIGQATFIAVEKVEWEEVEDSQASNRGGFGSSGVSVL